MTRYEIAQYDGDYWVLTPLKYGTGPWVPIHGPFEDLGTAELIIEGLNARNERN